jgi:hypothetical protein
MDRVFHRDRWNDHSHRKTGDGMKMIDVIPKFSTGDKCLDYLEQMCWPVGRCLCALRGNECLQDHP